MRKKIETPPKLCWDCLFSRPYDDERSRTPEGNPIFYHCYKDPNNIKRGLMDNTKACNDYKERRIYAPIN